MDNFQTLLGKLPLSEEEKISWLHFMKTLSFDKQAELYALLKNQVAKLC